MGGGLEERIQELETLQNARQSIATFRPQSLGTLLQQLRQTHHSIKKGMTGLHNNTHTNTIS